MKKNITTLIKTEDYQLDLALTPMHNDANEFNLELISYWAGAKNPNAPQLKHQTIVSKDSLKQLTENIQKLIK